MSAADLHRLVGHFGVTKTFTSELALAHLDAGLCDPPPKLLTIGAQLRAAVGRPVLYGGRHVALQRLGVTNSGARRWQFEIAVQAPIQEAAPAELAEPNEFL